MFPVSVWTLVTLINPVTLVNLNDHPDINEIGMLKVHLVYITWVLNAYQPKPKKFKFRFRDPPFVKVFLKIPFYRTQVSLGSGLWVPASLCHSKTNRI